MAEDNLNEEPTGFIDRLRESPRTVSALIIILIVAAAIYAFSGDRTQEPAPGDQAAIMGEGDETTPEAATEGTKTEAPDTTTAPAPSPEAVSQEELAETAQTLPEATQTAEGYQEVAQPGDGITHLARRAATRWLSANQAGYTVTNQHRIYIEDYIQNRIGTEGLNIGDTRTVGNDLIAEAVAAAGALNEGQLQNLSQYTHALE